MKSWVSIYKHKAQIHLYLQLLNKKYIYRKKKRKSLLGGYSWDISRPTIVWQSWQMLCYCCGIHSSPSSIQMNVNFAIATGIQISFDLGILGIPEKGGNVEVGGLNGVPIGKFPKPTGSLGKNVCYSNRRGSKSIHSFSKSHFFLV